MYLQSSIWKHCKQNDTKWHKTPETNFGYSIYIKNKTARRKYHRLWYCCWKRTNAIIYIAKWKQSANLFTNLYFSTITTTYRKLKCDNTNKLHWKGLKTAPQLIPLPSKIIDTENSIKKISKGDILFLQNIIHPTKNRHPHLPVNFDLNAGTLPKLLLSGVERMQTKTISIICMTEILEGTTTLKIKILTAKET